MAGGQPPKRRTSHRKSGYRQNNIILALKRRVNGALSQSGEKIKVYTTKRESAKKA